VPHRETLSRKKERGGGGEEEEQLLYEIFSEDSLSTNRIARMDYCAKYLLFKSKLLVLIMR
jgi:hypothetical protein